MSTNSKSGSQMGKLRHEPALMCQSHVVERVPCQVSSWAKVDSNL